MTDVIATFWNAFVQYKDLFAIPNNDKEREMDEVLAILRQIDPRIYYHFGYHDNGVDLLISAEVCYDLSDALVQVASAAPSLPGWGFRLVLDSSAFNRTRNAALFPDDENGDVLYGIAERAGDLITPREVDFATSLRRRITRRPSASISGWNTRRR
jgi:hypothetical protein